MDLERRVDVSQIISESGMFRNPRFYGGVLTATKKEVNDERLEKIYQGIRQAYGDRAADNFVKMVSDIPVLSAGYFLRTLYKLEANKWKWDKQLLGDFAVMFEDMRSVVRNPPKDETPYIRSRFLARRGIKTEEQDGLFVLQELVAEQ